MAKGRKSSIQKIELQPERKKLLEREIQTFFQEVRDEEIGVVATQEVMDFFLETLGKEIYNQALDDTKRWHQDMMENMESDFYLMYR